MQKIDKYFQTQGFYTSPHDPILYAKEFDDGSIVIIVLYVGDLIITRYIMDQIGNIKLNLTNTFEMSNLGFLHNFLGIQV